MIEISTLTIILCSIQVSFIPFFLISILISNEDKSRHRYLILNLSFIAWIIIDTIIPRDIDSSQTIIYLLKMSTKYGSAIFMGTYYFYLLSKEFKFTFNSVFNYRTLAITLVIAFVVCYFILYYLSGNHKLSYTIFILLTFLIVSFYCGWCTYQIFIKKNEVLNIRSKIIIIFSILCMWSFPLIAYLNFPLTVEKTIIFICLVTLFYAYIEKYVFERRKEYNELNIFKSKIQKKSTTEIQNILTVMEYEIFNKMIVHETLTFVKLGLEINKSGETVRTHAHSIYKKLEVKNKKELLSTYNNVRA